jgi:hypothetical protein
MATRPMGSIATKIGIKATKNLWTMSKGFPEKAVLVTDEHR